MKKGTLGIIILASISLIVMLHNLNIRVKDYRNLDNTRIISQYNRFLNAYDNECETTRYTYFRGYRGSQIDAKGNANWWNTLNSTAPEAHCSIFTSDNYQYSFSGTIENSNYLVTGLDYFSELSWYRAEDDSYIEYSSIHDNILNNLMGVDSHYKLKSFTVYVNSNNNIRIHEFFNEVYGVGKWDHITITDSLEDDYDLFMALSPTTEQVNDAVSKDKPIYAVYHTWWGNDESYKLFNVTLGSNGSSIQENVNIYTKNMNERYRYNGMKDVLDLMEFLNYNKLQLDFGSDAECTTSGCDWTQVTLKDDSSINMQDAFFTPVSELVRLIATYDQSATDIFSTEYNTNLKAALAFSDNIRKEIRYDFGTFTELSDHTRFFEALYADQVISYARPDNVLSNDLGDYSPREDEVQKLSTSTVSVNLETDVWNDLTATGIYIKAGQETTITRTDDHTQNITIYINFHRDASNRVFATGSNSYNRPYSDRSTAIVIEPGQTVTISTPKGGQLFVAIPNDIYGNEISLTAKNVLQSPYLDSTDVNSFADFLIDLQTTPINWADFVTPDMQLHSTTGKMIQSLLAYDNSIEDFIYDTDTYFIEANYYYAGILSDRLARSTNVLTFFEGLGLTYYSETAIHRRRTQHYYADEAQCGSLCSSGMNLSGGPIGLSPIDAFSHFRPLSWGENHEIGHNLQMSLSRIYGGASTEVSNNIYPLEVNRLHAIENGNAYYDVRFSYEAVFNSLKVNHNAGTAISDFNLWTSDSVFMRLAFYRQISYASDDVDFFPKLNIMTRIMSNYRNANDYEAIQAGFGLTNYTLAEAQAISPNDWMAIATSIIADRDMSEFFEGFGVTVSDKAKTQISEFDLSRPALGKVMYFIETNPSNANQCIVDFIDYTNKEDYLIDIATGEWVNPVA